MLSKKSSWIKGFEGIYKIFYNGKIVSFKQDKVHGKILKHKKTGLKGYLTVDLFINGEHNYRYIHKLLAEAFIKNPHPKKYKFVVHKDGNTSNNSLKNLQWCDAIEKGKIQKQNLAKKLKDSNMVTKQISNDVLNDIAYLRVLRKNEVYLSNIHKLFKVSAMTINRLIKTEQYKQVAIELEKIQNSN